MPGGPETSGEAMARAARGVRCWRGGGQGLAERTICAPARCRTKWAQRPRPGLARDLARVTRDLQRRDGGPLARRAGVGVKAILQGLRLCFFAVHGSGCVWRRRRMSDDERAIRDLVAKWIAARQAGDTQT